MANGTGAMVRRWQDKEPEREEKKEEDEKLKTSQVGRGCSAWADRACDMN